MSLVPGTHLGPYEIVAQIGVGGMGEVYKAADTNLKRAVAIKVLPASVAGDTERLARFQREAEVLAALNHPNIAAIYGLERSGATSALVMELVEGPTLADRIALGSIPLDEALPIAKQIADALEAAHEQGIVHRDLKPANIKIREDGVVKVLDFGLAKAMEPAGSKLQDPAYGLSQAPTITTPAMTQAGMILGTAAYMSPEQARGKPVDKRADIWAFGCVLFEMLTGKRVFDGVEVTDVLAAIITTPPDWNRLPEHTPQPIRRLLHRSLEKDHKRRLADAADARLEIEEALTTPRGELPIRIREKRPWLALALVCIVVTTAIATVPFLRAPAKPALMQFSIVPPQLTFDTSGAISPDGQTFAMVGPDTRGQLRIFTRRLDSIEWVPLAGTDGARFVFWSPDSRRLGFQDGNERKLKKIDLGGGVAETICDLSFRGRGVSGGASWGSNGMIVFVESVTSGLAVLSVSADGGKPTPVTKVDPSKGETAHLWPYFLPGGRQFLFLSRTSNATADAVYVTSIDGGDPVKVLSTHSMAVYSKTGHILHLRGSTLVAQPFGVDTSRLSGEPLPIAEGVGASGYGQGNFSATDNGMLVHWAGLPENSLRLAWRDRTGRELDVLPDSAFFRTFDLSPDEKHLAVHIHDARSGAGNLWLVDLDRRLTSRFTQTPTHDTNPVWSPDGKRIAFRSVAGDSAGIFQKNLSADDSPRQMGKMADTFALNRWSENGRFLLLEQGSAPGPSDIFALSVSAPEEPIPIADTRFNERRADFSPDGHWVVYQSDESGRPEVYIQSFPKRDVRLRISTNGGTEPRWRKDGKEVFFVDADSVLVSVPLIMKAQPNIGAATSLFAIYTATAVDRANHYQVSRDGQRILTAGDPPPSLINVTVNWPVLVDR